MSKLSLTSPVRQFYRFLLNSTLNESGEDDLGQSAMVFSPHQDDETLGCGGTIIRKKKAGADVKLVFMTDGSSSHAHLISENELKSIREREAIAAARLLGLEASDTLFLAFKDGRLEKHRDAAIEKVKTILLSHQPQAVFIPYYKESPSDHWVTNRVVLSALKQSGIKATVYEYPIWFWHHWPWIGLGGSRREKLSLLKKSLLSGFGLQILKDFRCAVYIGEVLELKRLALSQHKSQMTRLLSDPSWLTLNDVSNGEFVECFFQNFELFYKYNLPER
ncbi:LmbE-like protein [Hydrococcus rivularis NIES-593]|uniref:LmbE-like protein n=1 Tax=Hydrococcus rivularis NIES-593 TaxID=1921803 RepID=A0A1U7HHI0_9CYAN|nr:PIG-L family deacetylase [Hydrococcus rivularis]OKH23040.1 LmbE-like protein [Hydrococcus rivularis NIES-593]